MSLSPRSLGPEGLTVSALGLGCWGMSAAYGPTDDSESLGTLERALDLGVTPLDTSMSYGAGHNERLLARVLASRRDEVVLATQFGIVRDANGPRVDVNGATIYYEEHGDGAPLILVHGRLASSSHWQPVVAELAESFRVIRPDRRGHGRSTNPAGELTYAGIADDIAALIAALGLERPGGWTEGDR
jgi:hypothetical protein